SATYSAAARLVPTNSTRPPAATTSRTARSARSSIGTVCCRSMMCTWLRTPKMYGPMLGFQRRVWWPKWTPASSSWRRVNSGIAMGVCFPVSGCASAGPCLAAPDPQAPGEHLTWTKREMRPACELPAPSRSKEPTRRDMAGIYALRKRQSLASGIGRLRHAAAPPVRAARDDLHQPCQHPHCHSDLPGAIVVSHRVVNQPAPPGAEERASLVHHERDAEQGRHVAGAEHLGDQPAGQRHHAH